LILEEGFSLDDLKVILQSMKETADIAGVQVVTGDTKVVRKGEADGIYINTAGIGRIIREPGNIREGDSVIVTGTVGDHSVAVMVSRNEFNFEGKVDSDCMPLNCLLPLWNKGAKWMRDITRGGLATVLCELAESEKCPVQIHERKVPLSPPVSAVSEILGIDPLYLASEGKAVIIAENKKADEILELLKNTKDFKHAEIIGTIGGNVKNGEVVMKTISGGFRLLAPLSGELLPRIC
jgi:hydrogenase expression/formation protein HypE